MIHTLRKPPVDDFDALIIEVEKLCDKRDPEAINLIERAANIAQQSGSKRHRSLVSYARSHYDCLVVNNYNQAIERLTESLLQLDEEEFADIGYKPLMTLGNAYQMKGDVFSAQESYLKGLKCLEARKDLTPREQGFLAAFYYNVSVLLSASQLKIDTQEYLEKAIAICLAQSNKYILSKCYVAMAQALEMKEHYNTAIDYLHLALDIDIQERDGYSIALSKANLGVLSIKIKQYAQSFLFLNDALEYYEANNLAYETAMVKFEIAKALAHTEEYGHSLEYASGAEDLMLKIDNKKELTEVYQLKSQVHAKVGEFELAHAYLEKYVNNIKYFFDSEKTNALARAKKEFESEQKEKEAQLLRDKNDEIRNYVQKLENSNNELKQFAHAASHDLREPLRMITAYAGLLKKSLNGQLNGQQEEFFAFVIDGAQRMDQLIQGLLQLAKVDANPKIEHVRLNDIIDDVKLNLGRLIFEKNATVQANDLPILIADKIQMTQLLQNLVSNGLKYNTDPNPAVKIVYTNKGSHLEIAVVDNGTGIPEDQRDDAFMIFRRLHKHDMAPGSGIGLAICKKIVEARNGKIKIEDRPGGGSIFRIFLPKTLLRVTA